MRSRCFWLGLAPMVVGALSCGWSGSGDDPDNHPDIILVMIDTLRADHLGSFGHDRETSPALSAFAARATDYRRAYAQSSWTAPSVSSVLTSRYPRELGVHQKPSRIAATTRTLAKVLSERGYRTEAVFTNRYISSRYGHELGYDAIDERHLSQGDMVTSDLVTDIALDRARGAGRDQPLFMYVHYFDPHYDYVLHDEFSFGAPEPELRAGPRSISFYVQKLTKTLDENDMVQSRLHYDSEIAFTDHHVGRLLTGLSALGRFDDAVVVVVADHGEEFLDHGEIGHSVTLYDELIHVPLMIKAPNQEHGVRDERPAQLLDVAPTILALAGLPREPTHLGRPLTPDRPDHPIFTSTFHYSDEAAVIVGPHKAIIDYQEHTFELYDLLRDPHEQKSIAHDKPAMSALMIELIESWNEGPFERVWGRAVQLSDQEKAIMRSLGYGE